MPDLEVHHGLDTTVSMHELTRIPDDDAFTCRRAKRVSLQPSEAELEAGIRSFLGRAIGVFVDGDSESARIFWLVGA
jgi:hypothetical protein